MPRQQSRCLRGPARQLPPLQKGTRWGWRSSDRPGVSRPAGAGQGGQGSGTSVGFTADSQPARATQPLSLARRAKGPAAPTAAGGDGEAVAAATGAAALPAPQQCPPSHPDPKGQGLLQGKRAEGGTPAPRPLPAPGGPGALGWHPPGAGLCGEGGGSPCSRGSSVLRKHRLVRKGMALPRGCTAPSAATCKRTLLREAS